MSHKLDLTRSDHVATLFQLETRGEYHFTRFRRLGEADDIKKAVQYMTIELGLIPDDHPHLPSLYDKLGAALGERYNCLGEMSDLQKAMECSSRAIDLFPENDSNMPSILANLGVCYHIRFQRLDELDELKKSLEYLNRALVSTPTEDPRIPSLLTNLGTVYGERFQYLGDQNDLNKAMEHKSRAVALTPNSHPDLPFRLTGLGRIYSKRFDHLGVLSDLEEAIKYKSKAVSLSPIDDPRLPDFLISLGASLFARFQRLAELEDIEKAIECESRALAMTPASHPKRPSRLGHLGMSYTGRFRHLNALSDLEKAIEFQSQALALTPEDHADLPHLLSRLSVTHSDRFRALSEPNDIEKAVKYQSRALALTPSTHPHFLSRLMGLGVFYKERFEHLGESDDIEKAIEYLSRALALDPDDEPGSLWLLFNLGLSYGARFEHTGELGDIEKANSYALRALASASDGDPHSPIWHCGLARLKRLHAECTDDLSLFQDSLCSYRKASQSSAGTPKYRFMAALEWALNSSRHNSLCPIEAYQTTIDLLRRYVWLGATTNQRYLDLDRPKHLAVMAAAAAIRFSEYQLALEWLEDTRCVVWSQSLMLRSPLDQLQSSHSALAARLQTVASQLNHAGSNSQAEPLSEFSFIISDQVARKHRRLAKEYEDLLSEARELPGFEQFLKPIKADGLFRCARNGPVVVVNCGPDCCDALIILPGHDNATHLPLPNFDGEKAWYYWRELATSLRRKGIRERGVKVREGPGDKNNVESVLATLWRDVVKPILEHLGYMKKALGGILPHITWCPTGALSFLPLHAAGDYTQLGSRVFDYVVSSYTPTLTALLASRPKVLNPDCRVLAIGQANTPGHSPLPGTARELEYLSSHTRGKVRYSELKDARATTMAVLDAMERHDWVHLACHAHQNVSDPTKSGFFLHDGTLDLASINQRSFKNKGLAFLSACQTATGDENLPDEAIHLASGMLMAGYTSVIGTMWSVHDQDAPFVADKVYARLVKGRKLGNGEAGKALHSAVTELRNKVGEKEFSRWVPYIHIGS